MEAPRPQHDHARRPAKRARGRHGDRVSRLQFRPDRGSRRDPTKVNLPAGPGKDLVEARCTACHDLERVAAVERQKTEWPALVANMVGRGPEAHAITAYLTAHFDGQ